MDQPPMQLDQPPEISQATTDSALLAKVRLEHFYTSIISECADRESRRKEIEDNRKVIDDEATQKREMYEKQGNVKDAKRYREIEEREQDKRARDLTALGKREGEFLRQRRVKLGIDDFTNIKIIGKGAVCCISVYESLAKCG
jgi:protein-serine/threonine kinase